MTKPFASEARVREIGEYYTAHGDHETMKRFSLRPASLARYLAAFRRITTGAPLKPRRAPKTPQVSTQESKDRKEIVLVSSDIRTLDDLVAYCEVDTSVWQAERFIANSWGNDEYPCFQVKATFARKVEPDSADWLEAFRAEAKKFAPKYPRVRREVKPAPVLAEVDIFDPHMGKLAWHAETGGPDYDLRIAERIYETAVRDLADKIAPHRPEAILYPVGNDFFHSNNAEGTTAKGTRLDEEGRWAKTFSIGAKLVVRAVDHLSAIAPVQIQVVQGNHDPERTYYLGEYLSAWYRNSRDVTVDNRPLPRKYVLWGKCLIGLTHGDLPLEKLALLMSVETPEQWAASRWREWRVGHLHISQVKSFQQETEAAGVRIVMVPSLAAMDAWHSLNGFIAQREAQAALWHRENGKEATYYHRPAA